MQSRAALNGRDDGGGDQEIGVEGCREEGFGDGRGRRRHGEKGEEWRRGGGIEEGRKGRREEEKEESIVACLSRTDGRTDF